ncbi:unnamed protein product [Adineta ricciae]|uniref:Uncharacterized protein n=1 Tax=Adineta ricciae TaxID=249248 RepID=A0A816DR95_ADIRI|nr:unnamed protein product [Adineta ricciae]
MQIRLVIGNIDMTNSIVIEDKSFSAWIIDYYFTQIDSTERNVIGFDDMADISGKFAKLSYSMMELCQKKLMKIENDCVLEDYRKYLNHCELNDIIDIFLQCQLESAEKTILLSIDSFKNEIDQLLFEYLVKNSSVTCDIYDEKSKTFLNETKENLIKLIKESKTFHQQTNPQDVLKHTICSYLSLAMNTRNEHALVHCLRASPKIGLDQSMIMNLVNLSRSEHVTLYESLHAFHLENCDASAETIRLLKEFFDLIKQVHNKCVNAEAERTLSQVLNLIGKYLQVQDNRLLTDILEDFSQCFQTMLSLVKSSSSQSASSATRCFRRSIMYLCAKQALVQTKYTMDIPREISSLRHIAKRLIRKSRALPTIYETDEKMNTKRQPLQMLDVNSFHHTDERELPCENSIVWKFISDGDKENLPMLTRKRRMNSTKAEQSNKKQKKIDI